MSHCIMPRVPSSTSGCGETAQAGFDELLRAQVLVPRSCRMLTPVM